MVGIEGEICIDVYPQTGTDTSPDIKISSSRPLHAANILLGKTPEQALDTIPLLFSVCGVAQSRAALSAIQQAQHIPLNKHLELARDIMVLSENAKEHLLRIFLDWPSLFEHPNNNNNLPYITKLTQNFKTSLFSKAQAFTLDSQLNSDILSTEKYIQSLEHYLEQHVFNVPIKEWLSIDNIEQLNHWAKQQNGTAAYSISKICEQGWAAQGNANCAPLPTLENNSLSERFLASNANAFIAQPTWQEQCYETTSLSRYQHHPLIKALNNKFHSGLITRWVARLIELASIPQQMRSHLELIQKTQPSTKKNSASQGLSQVEAARGRLVHHVAIKNNSIERYQILAPTEWNFHPNGLIQESLRHIKCQSASQWAHVAKLLINTIDPCVGYQLRIH